MMFLNPGTNLSPGAGNAEHHNLILQDLAGRLGIDALPTINPTENVFVGINAFCTNIGILMNAMIDKIEERMTKTLTLTDDQIAALCPKSTPTNVVMVRSVSAGVFYGEFISRLNDVVTLRSARRCWYWSGAASLSQLATTGTTKPQECKFPVPTSGEHVILGVCEIIEVTAEALVSLDSVPIWKQP